MAPSSVCLRFLLILNQIKLIDVLAWFYCRCYCCMWIPFILDGLKNVIHTCPKCGSKLGEYTRFRMDRIWQKKKKHRQTQHNYTRGWQKNVWGRRYPCLWFDIKVPNTIIIWKHGNIKEILVTFVMHEFVPGRRPTSRKEISEERLRYGLIIKPFFEL